MVLWPPWTLLTGALAPLPDHISVVGTMVLFSSTTDEKIHFTWRGVRGGDGVSRASMRASPRAVRSSEVQRGAVRGREDREGTGRGREGTERGRGAERDSEVIGR